MHLSQSDSHVYPFDACNNLTHSGAIIGLAALGHATVSQVLIPQLQPYMSHLAQLLEGGGSSAAAGGGGASGGGKRQEAIRVQGALLDAVASAVYERMVAAAAAGWVASIRPPAKR